MFKFAFCRPFNGGLQISVVGPRGGVFRFVISIETAKVLTRALVHELENLGYEDN